jgi:hypothetical protein
VVLKCIQRLLSVGDDAVAMATTVEDLGDYVLVHAVVVRHQDVQRRAVYTSEQGGSRFRVDPGRHCPEQVIEFEVRWVASQQ